MGGDVYLGTRRIFGGGAPGGEPDADRRRLAAHFQEPARVVRAFEVAMEQGVTTVLSVSHPNLFAALRRMGRSAPAVVPVVPNIQGFMREAVEHGIIGAGTRRVRRMGFGPLVGLGLRSVARTPKILARDFPTLLRCFIEMELAEFSSAAFPGGKKPGGESPGQTGGAPPPGPLLQAQFTDLALAMNNPAIIRAFTDALGRRAVGGFATANPDALISRLGEWGIAPGAILAPHRRLTDEVLQQAGNARTPLLADHAGDPAPPPENRAGQNAPEGGIRARIRDDDALLFGPEADVGQSSRS